MKSLAIVAMVVAPAWADRPIHGSAGIGASFLLTGALGDRNRFEAELDLEPRSRFGALLALRGFDDHHKGIACAGLVYEAGAARPRIVLDLHADIGADLDQRAPMVGAGIRTTITLIGPLGIALDSGGYLVIDGVAATRMVIGSGVMIVGRW